MLQASTSVLKAIEAAAVAANPSQAGHPEQHRALSTQDYSADDPQDTIPPGKQAHAFGGGGVGDLQIQFATGWRPAGCLEWTSYKSGFCLLFFDLQHKGFMHLVTEYDLVVTCLI